MFFLSVNRMIATDKFLDYFKIVFLLDAFKDLLHNSIINKDVFCLGEIQGMLVKGDGSYWFNRLGDFCCEFGKGEQKFCMVMDQHAK